MRCKKTLAFLLVLILSIGMIGYSAQAAEDVISGVCGENITWTLNDGVLTISGSGIMTATPWLDDYNDKIERVVVEEGVTSLEVGAFSSCINLISADLPASLETIPHSLFRWCEKLERIEIPASVTEIGSYAFHDCTSLKTITIPDSVKTISEAAFWGCTGVETVDLGNGVENIEENAFLSVAITEITIPASVKKIRAAFMHCNSLGKVVFEGDAPSGKGAFSGMRGYAYYPANNSTWTYDMRASIGGSFDWVEGLPSDSGVCGTNATWSLNNGVLTISGSGKINDYYRGSTPPWRPMASEFSKIIISDGITEIGFGAFAHCVNVREVVLPEGLETIGNLAFLSCEQLTDITIPDSVKIIGEGAFEECKSLAKITIPSAVKHIDLLLFYGCTSLKEITFVGDAPTFDITALAGIQATVWYPKNNDTWTEVIKQTYQGDITWRALGENAGNEEKDPPNVETPPTEPKPTEPQPTEPDVTEPQPTEPEPTEPQETEPDNTIPDSTEPTEFDANDKPQQADNGDNGAKKTAYWVWGIAAGVVIIAGAAVWMVLRKRK